MDRTERAVSLRIPASSAYLSLARSATASVCARLDFGIDHLEDLTLAVDEALGLLLLDARAGTELRCVWIPTPDGVRVDLTSSSSSGRVPRQGTFAWRILTSLVDTAEASFTDGEVTLTLLCSRARAEVS